MYFQIRAFIVYTSLNSSMHSSVEALSYRLDFLSPGHTVARWPFSAARCSGGSSWPRCGSARLQISHFGPALNNDKHVFNLISEPFSILFCILRDVKGVSLK